MEYNLILHKTLEDWFKRIKEGITTKTSQKKEMADGLWVKCPKCKIISSKDDKIPLTFVTQDSAFQNSVLEELNIIIKSDVHGSSEAIKNAINQIKNDEVKAKIILADIGMVTETDVTLAKASNAVLIAFNV